MQLVDQLFGDYLHYRRHTAYFRQLEATKPYLREPKLNDERRNLLRALVDFCRERELHPRWWLYSLFHARRWVASPRWNQLVPGSPKTEKKALARYEALTDAPLYAERVTQEIQEAREKAGLIYDPNRDLAASIENLKRRYLATHNTERCMAEMERVTLGYHPRSSVCTQCPARTACEHKVQSMVPFDIVALRRGEMSSDQAKRIAGRHHG